jgi:uncharacterized delta-60 repeat protein
LQEKPYVLVVDSAVRPTQQPMKKSLLFSGAMLLCISTPVNLFGQVGSVDITFNPGTGPNDIVTSIAVQTNGQILVGGLFTSFNTQSRNRIARLNSDGSLDASFTPLQGPDAAVWSVEPDAGGKVLVGGSFTSVNSLARNYFARLRADGSLDVSLTNIFFNAAVTSIKRLADGSYLVVGPFTSVNGTVRLNVARLFSNGALDASFNPASKVALNTGPVRDAQILADGKVLLAGGFTTVDGTNRAYIARVDVNGSLDLTFDAGLIGGASVMTTVEKVLLQPDSKVIILGDFFSVDGYSRRNIARLDANGAIDATYVLPEGLSYYIRSALFQPDGKTVVVGSFSYLLGSTWRAHFARVNTNGSLDGAYYPQLSGSAPSSSGSLYSLSIQPDGKLLIGGAFTSINGTNINHLARLNADTSFPVDVQLLNPNRYFGAYIAATVSNTYRIEWTTNLNTPALWTPLFNVTLQTNLHFLLDPNPIAGRQRYYRAVGLP